MTIIGHVEPAGPGTDSTLSPVMPPFRSLSRRIVLAYLLFAAIASAAFAVIAVQAVESVEGRLVNQRLAEVASWASPRYAGHLPVELPAGLSFHHDAGI